MSNLLNRVVTVADDNGTWPNRVGRLAGLDDSTHPGPPPDTPQPRKRPKSSRLPYCTAYRRVAGPDIVASFTTTAAIYGLPASALTDNGSVSTSTTKNPGK